jgi:hypothetical protein
MDNPTVVAEFDNRMQAEITVNMLEGFGIHAQIWADDLGGVGPGQSFVHGVKVLVEAEDAERAGEVLAREAR